MMFCEQCGSENAEGLKRKHRLEKAKILSEKAKKEAEQKEELEKLAAMLKEHEETKKQVAELKATVASQEKQIMANKKNGGHWLK